MSLKEWWQTFLKRGFSFSKTSGWPGEKGLPDPNTWDPDVSKETINNEIAGSLKQKGA